MIRRTNCAFLNPIKGVLRPEIAHTVLDYQTDHRQYCPRDKQKLLRKVYQLTYPELIQSFSSVHHFIKEFRNNERKHGRCIQTHIK